MPFSRRGYAATRIFREYNQGGGWGYDSWAIQWRLALCSTNFYSKSRPSANLPKVLFFGSLLQRTGLNIAYGGGEGVSTESGDATMGDLGAFEVFG